jgi:hypothetical protein
MYLRLCGALEPNAVAQSGALISLVRRTTMMGMPAYRRNSANPELRYGGNIDAADFYRIEQAP